MKRMILCVFPMSICNFRCSYCYLSHRTEAYQGKQANLKYSPELVGKAFSKERLGGQCYFNFCADGETLLQNEIEKYIFEIARQGHFIEVVTNLTITPVINRILKWDKEILKRIEFKCSFHYLELKKHKMLDIFAQNANNIWTSGGSATIEITPSDELIPYLDEVKKFSELNFGALPHLTIARDDSDANIPYLTKLSMSEYERIWSSFESDFWSFKRELFGVKRNEYCYAGRWSLFVNMETGSAKQCYLSRYEENIFEDLSKEIKFIPIGKCTSAHCYNGHALLSGGLIPKLNTPGYGNLRNRKTKDNLDWLQPELKDFFNHKLYEENEELTVINKIMMSSKCINYKCTKLIKKLIGIYR